MTARYDCSKCPGYCCSYPRIELRGDDLKRLAKHSGISKKKARQRFIKSGEKTSSDKDVVGVLRHRKDDIFGTICIFFDREARRCGVYDARPQICRDYPGQKRCGYYEFLRFERKAQEDPDYIALTGN
nr:YkgJ family cysteine cluster protein [Desulfuromonadales bacterium]